MTPNPGSDQAKALGCICPIWDNAHGKGYLGGVRDPITGEKVFVIAYGCPIHDKEARNG